MTMDGTSTINANENGYGYTGGGLRAYGTSLVASEAEINILNNKRNGMENYGTFTMEDGVKFAATGNNEPSTNGGGIYNGGTLTLPSNAVITGNYAGQTGGGICNAGTVTIPDGVSGIQLYNNHAGTAGDDIYNRNSATISGLFATGDWALDGDPDCTDAIDGWYDDSDGSDERFEWKINVPVSNFAPVQLTYTVRLNGPRSDEGVYGTYDANGTQGAAGLYTNNSATLYPVDSNGQQGMPENFRKPTVSYSVGTVTVTPADITVYMGGDEGYEGVINGSDQITGSNSLPEPGFYFTLPDYVNEALRAAGVTPEGEAADLSQYMRIYTQGYTVNGEPTTLNWRLEWYGDTYSGAYERYIYRIVPDPTEGQEAAPVRLQFTSEDGSQTFTSDEFNPSSANALYEQYTMQLFTELVESDQVVFEIDVPSADGASAPYRCSMALETGTLTIRYVTGEQADVVTDVLAEHELTDARTQNPDKAFAVMPEDAQYFINGSDVDVTDEAAPSLLFDDVVSNDNTEGAAAYDDQLASNALDVVAQAAGTELANPQYVAKYLDLVDANNGNVWLRSSAPVTVYWPYPEGTDQSTEFHLVHFEGLDREMANGDISSSIESANTQYVEVENTEHGIKFTTTGFSPFVLMWDAGSDIPGTPDTPDTPDTPEEPADTTKPAGNVTKPADNGELPDAGDATNVALPIAVLCGGAALVVAALRVARKR